jgi:predicted metal-dependent HD superfamily phosphohydrolase
VYTKEKAMQRWGGSLGQGVLMISPEQWDDLCDRLSCDELDKYIEIVVACELNGKKYKNKTHYQAILDMVAKDRKVVAQC